MIVEDVNLKRMNGLNEAAIFLQKAFNDPANESHVLKAIKALRNNCTTIEKLEPKKLDDVVLEERPLIKTGEKWIDDGFGGGHRKEELGIFAGGTHSGKSHLLAYFGAACAYSKEIVLHFNGEDIQNDIIREYRILLTEKEARDRVNWVDVTDYKFSVDSIERTIEEMEIKPDVMIVDHLDILNVGKDKQDWLAISEATQYLRFIAKRFKCFVLTGSQANEDGTMFRGNLSKKQHSDIEWLIDTEQEGIYDRIFISVMKAKGRDRENLTKKFAIKADWKKMEISLL